MSYQNLSELKRDVKDTRERLIRMEEHIVSIKESLSKLPCGAMEKRMGILEHWRTQTLALASAISFAMSFIIKLIWEKIKGG